MQIKVLEFNNKMFWYKKMNKFYVYLSSQNEIEIILTHHVLQQKQK